MPFRGQRIANIRDFLYIFALRNSELIAYEDEESVVHHTRNYALYPRDDGLDLGSPHTTIRAGART